LNDYHVWFALTHLLICKIFLLQNYLIVREEVLVDQGLKNFDEVMRFIDREKTFYSLFPEQ